jgi:hypothetical protein
MGQCDPGFADCNGNPADGCEASLESPASCGACGVVCSAGQHCARGVCSATCDPPLTSCLGGGFCPELGKSNYFGTSCGNRCGNAGECDSAAPAGSPEPCTPCPSRRRPCEAGYEYCDVDDAALDGCVPVGTCGVACRPGCDAPAERCEKGRCVRRASAVPEAARNALDCGGSGEVCFPEAFFGLPQGWCDAGTCRPESSMQFLTELEAPSELVLAGRTLYFFDAGDLKAADVETREVRVVAAGAAGTDLQKDTTHLYWVSGAELLRLALDAPDTGVVRSPASGSRVAVNSTHAFFTSGSVLYARPKAGGPASVLRDYTYDGYVSEGDPNAGLGGIAADDEVIAVSARFDDPGGSSDGHFSAFTIPIADALPRTRPFNGAWPEFSASVLGVHRGAAYSYMLGYYDAPPVTSCERAMNRVETRTGTWRRFAVPCPVYEQHLIPPFSSGFAADDQNVYLGLSRYGICNGVRTPLSDLLDVDSVAVDETYLYFAKGSYIGRIPK